MELNEKEKLLIENIISDKEVFALTYGIVKPEYFEEPLGDVVAFIKQYFNEFHSIPTINIIKAETGVVLINHTLDEPQKKYTLSEIESHCKNEAMRIAIQDSVELLGDKDSASTIEAKIREALQVTLNKSLGTDLFENVKERLIRMQDSIDSRPIGWKPLDHMLDNIRRGELNIFAASSGAGKSIMMANIARNLVSQGLNGVIISLELNEELKSKRLDAIFTGIDIKDIFDKIDDVEASYNVIKNTHGNLIIKKMPNGSTASDVRAYLFEYCLQKNFYPDFIIIDYMDLMKPNDSNIRNQGKWDADKAIGEEIREIFVDYNAYGFSPTQLNRDAVDVVKPTHAHISGGISKINTSDATIAMVSSEENMDKDEIVFHRLKVRNAERNVKPFIMYLDPKTLRIMEHPPAMKGKGMGTALNKLGKNPISDALDTLKDDKKKRR